MTDLPYKVWRSDPKQNLKWQKVIQMNTNLLKTARENEWENFVFCASVTDDDDVVKIVDFYQLK